MGIKSKDDLRRYSLEELDEMCPKDKRLFVRLKKLKTIQEYPLSIPIQMIRVYFGS